MAAFFFSGKNQLIWLIVGLGRLVVWIPGIPENERDWDSWVYPDTNTKSPTKKPTINH